jgi:diaminopimelate decarboxylase
MKTLAGNPYLKVENGNVLIDSVTIKTILKDFETPLMIFIENRIRDNIRRFNRVFSDTFENFRGYYSVKANYLPPINEIISSEDLGAEIISLPELNVALEAGFPPEKIIAGGPYLSDALIDKCLTHSIKEIVIYNLDDIKRVELRAKKLKIHQDLCLRINPMKYESKLGVKIVDENCKTLKNILNDCSHIKITTLLSHYGSQMNSVKQYLKNVKVVADSLKLLESHGINVKNLNLGGGFPEATVMPEHQLEKVATSIRKHINKQNVDYENIYFEPGRYIVGDAAVFIAKIIKTTKNRWIVINIGNHICPKFARCSLRFYNASRIDRAQKYKTSIAGIIPTDQDVLAKDYFLTEEIECDDKILVTNVGAYCLTFSNRFPYRLPKIFLVNGNQWQLLFDQKKDKDFSIH